MFITAMYGIVDTEKNEMVYTNAGHLPIAVINPIHGPKFLECEPGMALGIWEDTEFSDNVHSFSPGEAILLYTDGVPEAIDKNGEEYGNDRFEELLRQNMKMPPNLLTQTLIASIKEFAGDVPQSDDITTLCLKYRLRINPDADYS
jgi:sigma-B regulation protein RsbU (phosphoserine phosphatase)